MLILYQPKQSALNFDPPPPRLQNGSVSKGGLRREHLSSLPPRRESEFTESLRSGLGWKRQRQLISITALRLGGGTRKDKGEVEDQFISLSPTTWEKGRKPQHTELSRDRGSRESPGQKLLPESGSGMGCSCRLCRLRFRILPREVGSLLP